MTAGRATLAQRAGMPTTRGNGFAAVLQQMLRADHTTRVPPDPGPEAPEVRSFAVRRSSHVRSR